MYTSVSTNSKVIFKRCDLFFKASADKCKQSNSDYVSEPRADDRVWI